MSGADDIRLLDSPPALRLDGRVAWITGASKGLGRAMAYAFAGAGADLVLSARSAEALEAVATQVRERGRKVEVVPGSVAEVADVEAAVTRIRETFDKLDVLVNNAGISPYFTRSERLTEEQLMEVLEVNTVGAFSCSRAALPLLEASDAASIVNIGSIHGSRAHVRILAYAAGKGALEMVTRTLAEEWAEKGVRVNSLAPGYIETDMTEGLRAHEGWYEELLSRTPLRRFASTEEIAACALFLASPAASYVTGATLFADGGWSAR